MLYINLYYIIFYVISTLIPHYRISYTDFCFIKGRILEEFFI